MQTPLEMIVLAFNDEARAGETLAALRQLQKEKLIRIMNAAVIVQDTAGNAKIRETEDVTGGHGAVFGAITGALIGLLAGPPGAIVGALTGAAAGGVAAHQLDMGFADEFLQEVNRSLEPGSSALIALIEHEWIDRVLAELEKTEGHLFRQAIAADVAQQLLAQNDNDDAPAQG